MSTTGSLYERWKKERDLDIPYKGGYTIVRAEARRPKKPMNWNGLKPKGESKRAEQ